MFFPTIIYDNFFDDPDIIVDFANSLEYEGGDGSWPGKRTDDLQNIDMSFKKYFIDQILLMFYPDKLYDWYAKVRFQKVESMHEDQYHIKNCGWIHKDVTDAAGGIVFLDKNPAEDTGTSLYKKKNIFFPTSKQIVDCKKKWYTGEDVSDEEYASHFHSHSGNFDETVRVKNVYNRLLLFNGNEYHGVHTYGPPDHTRLTLVFFITFVNHVNLNYPLIRQQ